MLKPILPKKYRTKYIFCSHGQHRVKCFFIFAIFLFKNPKNVKITRQQFVFYIPCISLLMHFCKNSSRYRSKQNKKTSYCKKFRNAPMHQPNCIIFFFFLLEYHRRIDASAHQPEVPLTPLSKSQFYYILHITKEKIQSNFYYSNLKFHLSSFYFSHLIPIYYAKPHFSRK